MPRADPRVPDPGRQRSASRQIRAAERQRQRQIARRRAMAGLLLAGLIVVAVAVFTVGGGSSHPAPTVSVGTPGARRGTVTSGALRRSRTTSTVPARPPVVVGVSSRTLTISEPSPAAIATGTLNGQPVRSLPTLLVLPVTASRSSGSGANGAVAQAGRFPLIVFSQGFLTPVSAYLGLLDDWARAGYVVAAPTYPRTVLSPVAPANENDILNHPADLRFVISALVAQAQTAGTPLDGLVNTREIAIAGQSDGADVTLAAAANTCCRIPGVKAALVLSGAELPGLPGTYYSSGSLPMLVTQGDHDSINVPGCSAALYDQAPAPKYYLDVVGAEHLEPYTDPGAERSDVAQVAVAFLNAYLKDHPAQLATLVRAGGDPPAATLTTAPELTGAAAACP